MAHQCHHCDMSMHYQVLTKEQAKCITNKFKKTSLNIEINFKTKGAIDYLTQYKCIANIEKKNRHIKIENNMIFAKLQNQILLDKTTLC